MNTENTKKRPQPRHVPWWVHILLAAFSYIAGNKIPDLADQFPLFQKLALLAHLAPIVTIGFLLLAANALYSGSDPEQTEEGDESTEKEPREPS